MPEGRASASSTVSYLILTVLGDTLQVCLVSPAVSRNSNMKPSKRSPVNKGRSAAKFRGQMSRTKAPNMAKAPMRGGWRM